MTNFSMIAQLDRSSVLHPATQLKEFASGKLGDPTIVTGGKGIRIQDAQGRSYIDGFAGLYCVNIGYGRTEVAEAIAQQAYKLAYYHSFAAHTTEGLAILSDRLVRMAPGRPSKVFFGLSGSDANETQAKLVWYYNNLRGQPKKKKIISRLRGFHGCSVIAGSMTGLPFYHEDMDLPVPRILHTGVPHYYWGSEPGETEESFSHRRAAELEALIVREGPDTVGAFIAEPVMGTGGIIPPPAGYWCEIQAVLKRYDVLLIADEVVCGFGRLGADFGSTLYGMEPDLVTVAKGLTSGYAPLSGAIVGEKVYAVIEEAAGRGRDRFPTDIPIPATRFQWLLPTQSSILSRRRNSLSARETSVRISKSNSRSDLRSWKLSERSEASAYSVLWSLLQIARRNGDLTRNSRWGFAFRRRLAIEG